MASGNREPLVAIITRTKDRPLFLERAAQSVIGQHFSDFIWIIVNDGGDQELVSAVVDRHRAELGDRVRVIHHPRSLGMQNAANSAVFDSLSTYVVIHDDDDSWDPKFLTTAATHLDGTGSMGVVTAAELIVEHVDGQSITTVERSRWRPEMRVISIYGMCWENLFPPIAFLFRREVFPHIGYFDQTLRGFGDWDFHLRFVERYDIDYLPKDILAYYHHRPDATGEHANSVFIEDQFALADILFNKWMRSDLERGQLGLGYVINALHNGPVNDLHVFNTLLSRIDEQAERLSKQIAFSADDLSDRMMTSVHHVQETIRHQHPGPVPISHRILRGLMRAFRKTKLAVSEKSTLTEGPDTLIPNERGSGRFGRP